MEMIFDEKSIINLVKGIAKVMGRDTEIVVHELAARKIVFIENPNITGRAVGDRLSDATYEAIRELADQDGHLISYGSYSKAGKIVRSSHLIVKDSGGEPAFLLCINQDVSRYKRIWDEIDAKIHPNDLMESCLPGDERQSYIQQLATRIIHEEIELEKTGNLDSKVSKMEVIRRLDRRGVFDVRDTVAKVCELLGISQATLYNYQREIRQQELLYRRYESVIRDFSEI